MKELKENDIVMTNDGYARVKICIHGVMFFALLDENEITANEKENATPAFYELNDIYECCG